MLINSCLELKYIESLTRSLLRINKIYIIITEVFHFRFTDCCEYLTPMLLVEDKRWIPFTEIIGKNSL